jgi:hypothetical protein
MEKINYDINWYNAPRWAFAHAFDMYGNGYYYGLILKPYYFSVETELSGWVISSEVLKFHKKTWNKSITFRPTINE